MQLRVIAPTSFGNAMKFIYYGPVCPKYWFVQVVLVKYTMLADSKFIFNFQLNVLQLEGSDQESECLFDVRTSTRDCGRRSSTNNNTETIDQPTTGSVKAVRSNSENTDSCEKTCVTTMSGSSIA